MRDGSQCERARPVTVSWLHTGGCRLALAALVGAVLAIGGVASPASAGAGHPPASLAAAAVPQTVRYYVVAPPENGHKEFLYEIAERVLHAGDRWVEIYKLNEGRPQPGGGALTDPQIIQPGWVLVLPKDASGPGVRLGPPPTTTVLAGSAAGPAGSSGSLAAPARSGDSAGTAYPTSMVVSVVVLCLGLVVGLPLLSAARRRRRPPPQAAPAAVRFGRPARTGGIQSRTHE
jgi:nucleoid-associated protein YgaU